MIITALNMDIFKIITGKNLGNMAAKKYAKNANKDTILIQITSVKLYLKDALLPMSTENAYHAKLAMN